jgi:hypothetical protein
MEQLKAKLNDANHPMTKMLSEIHSLKVQNAFNESNTTDSFAFTLVRALKASQTQEHYLAMYALWDDAPFKDISRMMMRMVYKYITTSYRVKGQDTAGADCQSDFLESGGSR